MPNNIIVPYLPKAAEGIVKAWKSQGNIAFIKGFQRSDIENPCRECAGLGVVYVVLCKGSSHISPLAGIPCTYFDGDDVARRGWYAIDRTEPFPCPECAKNTKQDKPYVLPPDNARPLFEKFVKKHERKDVLNEAR